MEKYFGKWNKYEVIWLLAFSTISIWLSIEAKDNFFGFSVFFTGVLCVVLTAKGNILGYVVGMYNTLGYAWLAYINHLFGEVGLNLLFFVPMNIVGYLMWKNHLTNNIVEMLKMKSRDLMIVIVFCLLCTIALGYGLSLIPHQNTPYIDASTNVLSVVATFLMIKRYREQWLLYISLNILTMIMWGYRVMAGSPEGMNMLVMWGAYLINAFYGYYVWSKGAKEVHKT